MGSGAGAYKGAGCGAGSAAGSLRFSFWSLATLSLNADHQSKAVTEPVTLIATEDAVA